MQRQKSGWVGMMLVIASLVACGDDPVEIDTNPPEVEPFVGTWDAEVFDVTSVADTAIVADLTENGSFTINVQASGTYTATLTFGGIPLVEIGRLSVSTGTITLRPNGGDPATSTYVFEREDYLTLDGPTEFDFNLDGDPDPAQGYIELQRR